VPVPVNELPSLLRLMVMEMEMEMGDGAVKLG
jgi:hypothetical protein